MLSPEQINACAELWNEANVNRRLSFETGREADEEYFQGKKYAVTETVATILGISWAEADDLLKEKSMHLRIAT